jgi:hypothetical protein
VDLHIHSPIRLRGVVLYWLSTGTTSPFYLIVFRKIPHNAPYVCVPVYSHFLVFVREIRSTGPYLNKEYYFLVFLRLLALRPLLAYFASLGW